MSIMNAFQILARKRLASLATEKVLNDDSFAKELANLLLKYGTPKEELLEILKEIKLNHLHNIIFEQRRKYVYDRFNKFDENLNWSNKCCEITLTS